LALTDKVPPTANVAEPEPFSVTCAGEFVDGTSVIVAAPFDSETFAGMLIDTVEFASPATEKLADDGVAPMARAVTPPVAVRLFARSNTTVPATPLAAKLPKFKSVFFVSTSGVTTRASTFTVAEFSA
jgi:hypothetical protein